MPLTLAATRVAAIAVSAGLFYRTEMFGNDSSK
jgi:hypothetical protein